MEEIKFQYICVANAVIKATNHCHIMRNLPLSLLGVGANMRLNICSHIVVLFYVL